MFVSLSPPLSLCAYLSFISLTACDEKNGLWTKLKSDVPHTTQKISVTFETQSAFYSPQVGLSKPIYPNLSLPSFSLSSFLLSELISLSLSYMSHGSTCPIKPQISWLDLTSFPLQQTFLRKERERTLPFPGIKVTWKIIFYSYTMHLNQYTYNISLEGLVSYSQHYIYLQMGLIS